jgi:hypothetical protein
MMEASVGGFGKTLVLFVVTLRLSEFTGTINISDSVFVGVWRGGN